MVIAIEQYAKDFITNPNSKEYADTFITNLRDPSGAFREDENNFFDYKDRFPKNDKSHEANFFRISLAFYNSYGGIIILGVHDKTRLHTNMSGVKPDMEHFNKRLRELTGSNIGVKLFSVTQPKQGSASSVQEQTKANRNKELIELSKRPKMPTAFLQEQNKESKKNQAQTIVADKVNDDEIESFDLLVIPKRPTELAPAILKKDIDKYKSGSVFLRFGPEVLLADSSKISFLFGPREFVETEQPNRLYHQLPGRPNTIAKFVGRVSLVSTLVNWITQEDEPRKFLWGDGGSGKSTVAYEFAKIFVDYGSTIKTVDQTYFERVIFISAKEKQLRTADAKISDVANTDFSDVNGLLFAIAEASNYAADLDLDLLDKEKLVAIVREIFDHESQLIIIDDIDTLTVKNLNPGSDLLYKLAIKAEQTIRILYTQRGKELENAIEVPGFEKGEDLEDFIKQCCKQFEVEQIPPQDFVNNDLYRVSNGIPLIVETLIGLRKVSGTYPNALKVFMDRGGEDARNYLFGREYEVLSKESKAREILCVISEFGRPISNPEISAVLANLSDDLIMQALGEVTNFFLTTDVSTEGETVYSVKPLTRAFLKGKTQELNFGQKVKEAIKDYNSKGKKIHPKVRILINTLERLIAKNQIAMALSEITKQTDPEITENAAFKMVSANVYCQSTPPRHSDARDCYEYCLKRKYEDLAGMRQWYKIEFENFSKQQEICDLIIQSNKYEDNTKNEFRNKKASSLYFNAKHMTSLLDRYEAFSTAVSLRSTTYSFFSSRGTGGIEKEFRLLESVAYELVDAGLEEGLYKEIWLTFKAANNSTNGLVAPLDLPLQRFINNLQKAKIENQQRAKSILGQIIADIKRKQITFERDQQSDKMIKLAITVKNKLEKKD